MKKHVIAAAVASAFAVPAVAQNVSMSGTLDVNPYALSKVFIGGSSPGENRKTTSSTTGSGWSTSVINFTATEDLGGGLKATAFVNQVINATDGTLTARDRWINLSGSMGSIQAGRFSPAIESGYTAFAVAGTTNTAGTSDSSGYDLLVGSLGYDNALSRSIRTNQIDNYVTDVNRDWDITAVDAGRQAGIVQFTSPVMNGFKVTAEYIGNDVDRDATARTGANSQKQTALRLDYSAGPLTVGMAMGKRTAKREASAASSLYTTNSTGGVVSANTNVTTMYISGTPVYAERKMDSDIKWLGASYDLGSAVLLYAYGARKDEQSVAGAASTDVSNVKIHNIGVRVPMGATTLSASYYKGDDSRTSAATDDIDHDGFQIGARYALSKRTSVYVVTGENKATLSTGASNSTGNSTVKSTNVGLIHTF